MQRPRIPQEIGRAPSGLGLVDEGRGAGVHRSRPGFVLPDSLTILVLIFASFLVVLLGVSSRRLRLALEANKKLTAELQEARASQSSSSHLAQLLDALDVPGGKVLGAAADALLSSGASSPPFPVGDFPDRLLLPDRGQGPSHVFEKCAKPMQGPFKGKLRRSRRFPGWIVGEWNFDGRSGLVYSLRQGVGRPVVRVWYTTQE